MRLSFPIYYLQEKRYGLEKALALVKDAGFDAIDYSLGALEKDDSVLRGGAWREEALRIRELADRAGLVINQTHAPFHFTAAQWSDEAFVSAIFSRCLIISGILGADVAVIHPLHHYVYEGHEEEIFEKNIRYYRSLIPIAKEAGVKIGVENMWQNDARRKVPSFDVCSTVEEFIRYVDTLDSEWVVACLDIGHVGLPQTREESWDFIRALGHKRLLSLHVHDNDYRGDQHLMPYTGLINWQEVTRALGEIDYAGDFTYETAPRLLGNMDDAFLPVGLKFMVDVGRHLIDLIDANRPQK